jgi:hypothetical protein
MHNTHDLQVIKKPVVTNRMCAPIMTAANPFTKAKKEITRNNPTIRILTFKCKQI